MPVHREVLVLSIKACKYQALQIVILYHTDTAIMQVNTCINTSVANTSIE